MTAKDQRLRIIMEVQQQMMVSDFDLKSFMQLVCDRMCMLTPAHGSTIEILDEDDMVYAAVSGTLSPYLGIRLSRFTSLSGKCVAEKKILYAADTTCDERVDREACQRVGARSMVCVPLFKACRAVGVLKVIDSEPDAFSPRDIETMQLLSIALGAELSKQMNYEEKVRLLKEYEELLAQLRLEIKRREALEQELVQLTERDVLTGLLNRRGFSVRLQQWMQRAGEGDGQFGVFYLDLNKFKQCNDTYGHEIGDLVLKEFAHRLKQAVSEHDLAARVGGDEFVLAAWLPQGRESLLGIARGIIAQMETPMQCKAYSLAMSTSVGCTVWSAGMTEIELIRLVDESMYLAKSSGLNRIAVDGNLLD
ncbi:sensor domain-containing diguanylate cyclase [Paenibacillus ferrarius]|uniref:sensor domain-containing diguanylate cyclase n=1 Tax=Paenibacillus ferrarius TaxID=1469647 RepID=UPI003D2A4C97